MTQDDARARTPGLMATQGSSPKQLPLRDLLGAISPAQYVRRLSPICHGCSRIPRTRRATKSRGVWRYPLLYSVNKQDAKQPVNVLRGSERKYLEQLDEDRRERAKTDRSCAHCRLLVRNAVRVGVRQTVSAHGRRQPPGEDQRRVRSRHQRVERFDRQFSAARSPRRRAGPDGVLSSALGRSAVSAQRSGGRRRKSARAPRPARPAWRRHGKRPPQPRAVPISSKT